MIFVITILDYANIGVPAPIGVEVPPAGVCPT